MNTDKAATYVSGIFLIFGGTIPFIPQYIEISKSGDASGFSTFVCFVLIVANVLRIVYWFGHAFTEILLIQSFVMILTMLAMLELCLRVEQIRHQAAGLPLTEKYLVDFNLRDFWQWTYLSSYLQATLLIAVGSILLLVLFLFFKLYAAVEGIGYAALLAEACLALPQFLTNLRNRSVKGMKYANHNATETNLKWRHFSVLMVVMWTTGDAFKEFYYIWRAQPFPFILSAGIQLFFDFLLFVQIGIF